MDAVGHACVFPPERQQEKHTVPHRSKPEQVLRINCIDDVLGASERQAKPQFLPCAAVIEEPAHHA